MRARGSVAGRVFDAAVLGVSTAGLFAVMCRHWSGWMPWEQGAVAGCYAYMLVAFFGAAVRLLSRGEER